MGLTPSDPMALLSYTLVSYWIKLRALDAGAHGIMTPMCHTEVCNLSKDNCSQALVIEYESLPIPYSNRPMLLILLSGLGIRLSVPVAMGRCLRLIPLLELTPALTMMTARRTV